MTGEHDCANMTGANMTGETISNPVVVLPGELCEDVELVDRAVDEVNRLVNQGVLQTALAVGRYVVDHFFGGDYELFRRREAGHVSSRALAARERLTVTAADLWTAVNITIGS